MTQAVLRPFCCRAGAPCSLAIATIGLKADLHRRPQPGPADTLLAVVRAKINDLRSGVAAGGLHPHAFATTFSPPGNPAPSERGGLSGKFQPSTGDWPNPCCAGRVACLARAGARPCPGTAHPGL